MIQPIGAIGGGRCNRDPEYMKIIAELTQLGISPTGNKQVDKAKLEEEKEKLVKKIQEKTETKQPDQNDAAQKAAMEITKPGAMTIAELNKLLHGIK